MTISAVQVKQLRERTGLGMMECKKALVECKGDIDQAIELLRKRSGAKVEKRAGRTAAEGRVGVYMSGDRKIVAMVEVNAETDFVAKEASFVRFVDAVAAAVAKHAPVDVNALMKLSLNGSETVKHVSEDLLARIGENIGVRRFMRYEAKAERLDSYVHAGARIGVVVALHGGDETLAHDIAMHIAAARPDYLTKDDVPPGVIAKERDILVAQVADSGKAADIVEKMIAGRLNKYLSELTLLGQPFVKDPDTTVEKLLKSAGARVIRFCRYEVGEGLGKDPGGSG